MKKTIAILLSLMLIMAIIFPASAASNASVKTAKLNTSPYTVDWYVDSSDFNFTFDPKVTYTAKVLQEKMGVKINFSYPVGGDEGEKMATMIASNSLPDVVSVGQNSPNFGLLEQGGMLQPLNKLMDKYAPGFKSIIPKSMLGWYTYTDGNMYGFPCNFQAPEQFTSVNYLRTNTGFNARKEIMDKLGIKADDFKTQDGTIAALKKVKASNMLYNGKKIIPVWVGFDVVSDIDDFIRDFWGITDEQKDGTYGNRYKDPRYIDMLKFFNKLYTEGLLPAENFTGTYDTQAEKITSGQVFSAIGCIGDYLGPALDLYRNDKNVKWVGVGPLNAASGTHLKTGSMSGWLVSCISKGSKYGDRLVSLFNYLYSDEGQALSTVGVLGKTYTLQGGKAILNPDIKAEFEKNANKATLKYGTYSSPDFPGILWFMYNPLWGQKLAPKPITPTDKMSWDNHAFFNKYAFPCMAFEGLNPTGGSDEAATLAQVNKLKNEMMAKAILSKTPQAVADTWNKFLAQLDSLGYSKVLKVMNTKFQANKKKLGLKFVYPGYK